MDNRNVFVKWANCCRLCLLDDGIQLPIFEGEGIQRQVARKIQTCFPILIYVGDPLPKMICHKCLYKLDTVYDFRLKCLEANNALKSQLLNLKHIVEVKQYLDKLEASGSKKEPTKKPVSPAPTPSVRKKVIPEPVVACSKDSVGGDKAQVGNSSSSAENVFQKVFLADCSTDVFFPEQSSGETIHQGNENGNRLPPKPQTRPAPASNTTKPVSSVPVMTIKQEVEETDSQEGKMPECPVLSQQPAPSTPAPPPPPPPQPPPPRTSTSTPPPPQTSTSTPTPTTATDDAFSPADSETMKHEVMSLGCPTFPEGMSRWSCEHCNKYYKSRDTLYKHKKYFCPKKKNSFVCSGCGKTFGSVTEVAQHQLVHLRVNMSLTEDNLYTCGTCGKKFAARSMLEMHKKTHSMEKPAMAQVQNPVQKKFRCRHCPGTFMRRSNLKVHMKAHFSEKTDVGAPEWDNKPVHTDDKDDDSIPQWKKKCRCKYCGHTCEDSTALWLHMLSRHSSDQAYKCEECGRSFNHQHAYSNHIKTHCVKVHCRVCGKPYSSPKALQEHEYNKHNVQMATHHCRLCPESFVTRSALLIHGRVHHSNKKSKGDTSLTLEEPEGQAGMPPCSERPEALVVHVQSHVDQGAIHNEKDKYPSLICKICGRLFSTRSGLQRHIQMHASGKHTFFPCKVCGKKFLSEATCQTHEATHLVSKSFHCPQCNKIFFKEETFKIHACENVGKQACVNCGLLLTEEQVVSHVCKEDFALERSQLLVRCGICSAVFGSMHARNNHMRIHLNQNPLPQNVKRTCVRMSNGLYRCNTCGKLTTTQQGAAAHARWHITPQPSRPYNCPFCNRRYTTETGLYTHISAEHPDLPT